MNRAEGKLLVNLLAEDHSRANKSGKHRIMLEGYGYRWYRVGGLDYLQRRTDIDQKDTDAGLIAAKAQAPDLGSALPQHSTSNSQLSCPWALHPLNLRPKLFL